MQAQAGISMQRAPPQRIPSNIPMDRQWQSDRDSTLRRDMRNTISQLIRNRTNSNSGSEWQRKADDFAVKFEAELYNVAKTEEEYMDRSSLDKRLQMVAKQMSQNSRRSAAHINGASTSTAMQNSSTGNSLRHTMPATSALHVTPSPQPPMMMPTPGLPHPPPQIPPSLPLLSTPGYVVPAGPYGGMIPTPGMVTPDLSVSRPALPGSHSFPVGVSRVSPLPSVAGPASTNIRTAGIPSTSAANGNSNRHMGQVTAYPRPNPFHTQRANTTADTMSTTMAPSQSSVAAVSAPAATPAVAHISPQRALQYEKQIRFLRFLFHGAKCPSNSSPSSPCPQSIPSCQLFRQLYSHASQCHNKSCAFERCKQSQLLLEHHASCRMPTCPVCIPVRHNNCRDASCPVCPQVKRAITNAKQLQQQQQQQQQQQLQQQQQQVQAQVQVVAGTEQGQVASQQLAQQRQEESPAQHSPSQPPSAKRMKTESGGGASASCSFAAAAAPEGTNEVVRGAEGSKKMDTAAVQQQQVAVAGRLKKVKEEELKQEEEAMVMNGGGLAAGKAMSVDVKPIPVSGGSAPAPAPASVSASASASASGADLKARGGSKGVGTSLAELFTPEMIERHLQSLKDTEMQQLRGRPDKSMAAMSSPTGDECKLCGIEKLYYDPPPIYCTVCGKRIQRLKYYYTIGSGEQRQCFCTKCHGDFRSDTIAIDGYPACSKSKLEKRANSEESEEGWVECGTCKSWVHQVCSLFNIRRNEGNIDFTCPVCCKQQMEAGQRQPLPATAVLGAKDLPRTHLSDELERRLERKLVEERESRARAEGKRVEEVPAAEELVVRVVSSVDKKLQTKPRFLSIFATGDYPTGFPYKSKVVLLFQCIEGVEVCLFGMYLQEFGSDCEQPNNRRVYLSYLDSVKYFRPDVRTESREALRTFVYHEILIGYLDSCKRRGFTSCYIWACPPLKGEDYILYCHPEIQKTPQPAKLREWYLAMLRKAQQEGIVVEVSNLYETFFVTCGESRAPVKAGRLPYFDGDYWPGAIEDVLQQLQEDEREESKKKGGKKGKKMKASTKRGAVKMEDDGNATMDEILMSKLGESILSMKEDFIMVHMRYCCTHCKGFILGDHRWVCQLCPTFNLCPRCHDLEKSRNPRDRHPILSKEAHELTKDVLEPAPVEIQDPDEMLESEFFDTRQAFLSLCQGNHYQYDTLRRAKHSSMMVLYHLHNPTAPAFVSTCNACQSDIEPGQGWRCEQCDYDICDRCHSSNNNPHPHPLQPQASQAETSAQNQAGRQMRVNQMRKILDLLQHASRCKLGVNAKCTFPKCPTLHKLFRHGQHCKVRLNGGCKHCKQMWILLRFHARSCKENNCMVPRCRDLRDHFDRAEQQSESRRRAAVNEMMRQRAAESRRS